MSDTHKPFKSLPESLPHGVIRLAEWYEPGAVRLRQLAFEELCFRYETDYVGEEPDPAKLVAFVVISVASPDVNVDVACAALMDASGEYSEFPEPVVEIKRVFVHPDYRGMGLSRHLMTRVAEEARSHGVSNDLPDLRLILETGTKQPEALALYSSLGYVPIPTYGEWSEDELSRCFELPLKL